MKKAAVLGATGGMGSALVEELTGRGIETVAFARSKAGLERLRERVGEENRIHLQVGDALKFDDIREAIRGCDTVFQSINLPYQDWYTELLPLTRRILDAVKEEGARLVMIDNIYSYGAGASVPLSETGPKLPNTRKGRLRQQMDEMILQADREGQPCQIVHFPDFYGPGGANTSLHFTFKSLVNGKRPGFVGPLDTQAEYIYLPDGARACVELSLRPDAYGQEWNVPGAGSISGREILQIAAEALGHPVPRAYSVGRGMLRMIGLFNPLMREAVEMMYIKEQSVILSGSKYQREIGPLPATPYREGIRKTVEALSRKKSDAD